MAGRQKLSVSQIDDDFGHEGAWNLERKKEDDEMVPFYLLLASGIHHDGRNLTGEKTPMNRRAAVRCHWFRWVEGRWSSMHTVRDVKQIALHCAADHSLPASCCTTVGFLVDSPGSTRRTHRRTSRRIGSNCTSLVFFFCKYSLHVYDCLRCIVRALIAALTTCI